MDERQFEARVLAVERSLYRMAYLMLHSQQDREDAIQEAILRAWHKRHTLREAEYFQTWLTRILINECRRIRSKKVILDQPEPEQIAFTDSPEPELYFALGELEDKYRLPVILYYVEGYTIREISSLLHIPQGTVSWRLQKALKLLKQKLEVERYEKSLI